MDEIQKDELISNMTENLPTLRRKLSVSQEELANMVGVSRSTLAAIEGKKRKMSWNIFYP